MVIVFVLLTKYQQLAQLTCQCSKVNVCFVLSKCLQLLSDSDMSFRLVMC